MRISFGATTIYDNLAGDLNPLPDIIDFNGVYAPALYQVSGTLTQVPGPSGISASSPLSLTLTNFVAQAVPGSNFGMPMDVSIESKAIIGTYLPGTAADSVSAEVGNAVGAPVPAGTDVLTGVYSIINDISSQYPISTPTGAPLPIGNPVFPGGFGTVPYPITGHTNSTIPTLTNPKLLGVITFSLGQINDQFIMPSSYEIGYQAIPVPEPSTLLLMGLAGVGAVFFRKDRQKVAER